jgi:hypothetical protein
LLVAGLSVISTWLYNNTGSLLVTGLFNFVSFLMLAVFTIFPAAEGASLILLWLALGFIWLFALVVTYLFGSTYLSRDRRYTLFGGFSWE